MFMISILSAFPVSSLYGVLCDRMKIWKLLLFNCLAVLISSSIFVYGTLLFKDKHPRPTPHRDASSYTQDFGFIILLIFTLNQFQLNYSLLSKGLKDSFNSIGLSVGAYSLFGSVGVILIDKLGGDLFEDDNLIPFFIAMGAYAFHSIIIICLALCRQLKI